MCPYLCICFSPLSSFHFEFLSFLSSGEFFLLHCVFYTHSVVFLSQSFLEFVKRGHLSKIHSNFCVCECVCVCICVYIYIYIGGSDSKESACNVGDLGSIPELEGGHGNPLQYSSLENPRDRGAWWGVTDTEQVSTASIYIYMCVCVCVCVCVYN